MSFNYTELLEIIEELKQENGELKARLNQRSGVSQNEQPSSSGATSVLEVYKQWDENEKAANQAAKTRRRHEQDRGGVP